MKHDNDAHWVTDGCIATLRVAGKIRAHANTDFNWATIYTPRGLFGKADHNAFVVPLEKVIISEIEKKLGFSPLPAFDKSGKELTDFRNECEARARSFDDNRPSDDPVGEVVKRLDKAHEDLNVVAREGGLNTHAAEARLLCIKARLSLIKERQFSEETARTIEAASLALTNAVLPRPVLAHAKLADAGMQCKRASALARKYGPAAELQTPVYAAKVAPGAKEPVEAFVGSDKVTITKGDPAVQHWLHGHLNKWPEYTFDAKVYDVGSQYGIDGGRVSKLDVKHKGQTVMSYDRGWEQKPGSWKEKAVLKEVLAGFPPLSQCQEKLSASRPKGARTGRGF